MGCLATCKVASSQRKLGCGSRLLGAVVVLLLGQSGKHESGCVEYEAGLMENDTTRLTWVFQDAHASASFTAP